jgi:hypothetical protein
MTPSSDGARREPPPPSPTPPPRRRRIALIDVVLTGALRLGAPASPAK